MIDLLTRLRRTAGGVILLAATAAYPPFPSAGQDREAVADFSGSGAQVTAPFTVGSGWSVEWSTEDERIDIYLKGLPSKIPSLVASATDPGKGRTVYVRGGTFHFEIRGDGAWRIWVFDD